MILWRDGALLKGHLVPVDALDRGLLLGDGLFETLKVAGGKALFLDRHLCRMADSAAHLSLPLDRPMIRQGVAAVLGGAEQGAGSLRVSVTRGPGPRGLAPIPVADQRPSVLVTFFPVSPAADGPRAQDRLVISPWPRASRAVTSRHKTFSYADNLAARAAAAAQGAADAIVLNERGHVASTTMANLFVEIERDAYATPPLSAGILPGVTRAILLEAAATAGITIKVTPLRPADLEGRRLYRTNSLLGVAPAVLCGHAPGDPPADTSLSSLEALYREAEQREKAS